MDREPMEESRHYGVAPRSRGPMLLLVVGLIAALALCFCLGLGAAFLLWGRDALR